MITSQLNVTKEQARGGAGLLFKLAQDKLDAGEFSQITNAIPGIDNLISSAPESGGFASAIGGLTSAFGGGAGKLGDLVSLAGSFSKLNLDANMIGKFIPIVLSFVQSQGGDGIKGLLEKVLND
jgi:hypothetical protein